MRTLLICPAIRPAVTQFFAPAPLATVSIFGECLVNLWLEHLAAQGVLRVIVIVADRPAAVRAAVGDGRRWGLTIEFIEARLEPTPAEALGLPRAAGPADWMPPPLDVIVMNHLPGRPDEPLFESIAGWFAAVQAWMPRAVTPARVRVKERAPGVWVGSGARISPRARLLAPCWIGDHALVEDDAVVGPNAIVEDRAIVSEGARVTDSIIGPDTFVGRLTVVAQSLALGRVLINWRNESVLHVPDPFLLCSLTDLSSPTVSATLAAATRVVGWPLRYVTTLFSRPNRTDAAKLSG